MNPLPTSDRVASKPNYGFEKRKKEQDRKQKKEAKLVRRQEEAKQRAEEGTADVMETDSFPRNPAESPSDAAGPSA